MGGGGVCEVEGVASVANHRELPDRSAELCERKGLNEGGSERSRSFRLYRLLAHREKFTREADRTTEERRLCVFEGVQRALGAK